MGAAAACNSFFWFFCQELGRLVTLSREAMNILFDLPANAPYTARLKLQARSALSSSTAAVLLTSGRGYWQPLMTASGLSNLGGVGWKAGSGGGRSLSLLSLSRDSAKASHQSFSWPVPRSKTKKVDSIHTIFPTFFPSS